MQSEDQSPRRSSSRNVLYYSIFRRADALDVATALPREVLSTFLAARLALAAKRLRRPVRLELSRREDLATSGQRHPFRATYSLGYDPDGRIQAYFRLEISRNCTRILSMKS